MNRSYFGIVFSKRTNAVLAFCVMIAIAAANLYTLSSLSVPCHAPSAVEWTESPVGEPALLANTHAQRNFGLHEAPGVHARIWWQPVSVRKAELCPATEIRPFCRPPKTNRLILRDLQI